MSDGSRSLATLAGMVLLGLAVLIPLGVVFVLETMHGQAFTEPPSLATLAGVIVTSVFAHGVLAQQRQVTAGLTEALAASSPAPAAPPAPPAPYTTGPR